MKPTSDEPATQVTDEDRPASVIHSGGCGRLCPSASSMTMSLLSQLAPHDPFHGVETVVTIAIVSHPSHDLPTPSILSRPSSGHEARRSIDDAQLLARILLSDRNDDEALAALEAGVDEFVDVWTPALHIVSRHELMSALVEVDDAIGDVVVTFTESEGSDRTAFLAWRATGRFLRPAFLDDDHIVEPDGSVIRLAGVTCMSFTAGHRADRIRCYYDRLTLVEQLVRPPLVSGAA